MFISLETIDLATLIIRLLMACGIGFVLGFERKQKNKPIGYQSFMIICVITCLIGVMSAELYVNFSGVEDELRLDIGKIISGTLTGIGFLGAGAIMQRDKEHVRGMATGASIWAAGALGLMIGFGHFTLAMSGFVMIVLILSALPRSIAFFSSSDADSKP